MEITRSNNWRNKINIKSQFEENTTPELVIKLCDSLINQINQIKNKEEKSNLTEDSKYYVIEHLEELVDHFDFLKSLSNGTIIESEFDDYCFDGDHEKMFNDYLSELYDLADERVITKTGKSEKFLWVD